MIKVAEKTMTTQAMVAPTRIIDPINSMLEDSKMCLFVVWQVVCVWISCIWSWWKGWKVMRRVIRERKVLWTV
jgi:hypothetical protein